MTPLYLEMKKKLALDTIMMSADEHRELLNQVCKTFDIKHEHDLDIMKEKQTILFKSLTDCEIDTRVIDKLNKMARKIN